jgi:hypothetical protein
MARMVSNDGVPRVIAEWAVWGKRAVDTGYRVLACSDGSLKPRDFAYLIDRYAPGRPDLLPQYTVAWVPGPNGGTEHIAVAIHERAPDIPKFGRESVIVRLFCFRYADLAEYGMSYAEMVDAVRDQALVPGQATRAPVLVQLPGDSPPPRPSARIRELAENVAALLLTTRPVGVLGAGEVPAAARLAFIDLVVSLLPFGLRANFSASTWVSSTAQVLNFRLFFASAARDDGRSIHVRWDGPDPVDVPDPGTEPARLYLGWLRRTGQAAVYMLADQTAPLRFTGAEIGQLIGAMPLSPNVDETLEELAHGLRADDRAIVKETIGRLKRYLAGQSGSADREAYRQFIIRHGLLADHPALDPRTKASLYQVLLPLAFDKPLTYASYCEIEDAIGGPPRGTLRKVMLEIRFTGFIPWFLLLKAEPDYEDEALMAALNADKIQPTRLLDEFAREAGQVRPAHRAPVYDFAVHYLRENAENPSAELRGRGYLAHLLAVVFPGDALAQRSRLEEMLRLVYRGPLGRSQIRGLFDDLDAPPTAALEAAVTRLASWPKAGPFIADQAALARLRHTAEGRKLV